MIRTTILLCLFAILPLSANAKRLFEGLEESILSGNLDAASAEVEEMFDTRSIVTSPAVKSLAQYRKILEVLRAARSFRVAAEKFSVSESTHEELWALKASHGQFRSAWSRMPKSLQVSKEIVQLLNETSRSVHTSYSEGQAAYNQAQEARSRAREEEAERQRNAREHDEQERLAVLEAERQAKIEQQAAQEKTRLANLDSLDIAARDAGFKGLNEKYGVGRFLYYSSKSGTLANGLQEVFWTDLSKQDARIDAKFKLTQVVEDWEIYELRDWSGDELVELSIVIPASGLPMQGQQLRSGFYLFQGNMTFETVAGTKRIIQQFLPVTFE